MASFLDLEGMPGMEGFGGVGPSEMSGFQLGGGGGGGLGGLLGGGSPAPAPAPAPQPGGLISSPQQPASGAAPPKPTFMNKLAKALMSDELGDLGASLEDWSAGDNEASKARQQQQESRDKREITRNARDDMEAEALAAKAAMRNGGWDNAEFTRAWGDRKRPPDPERIAAYQKLYGVQSGIAGTTPYTRDPNTGAVTWGKGAPISEDAQAKLDLAEQRQRDRDEYNDRRLQQIERSLNLQERFGGQRVDISRGQLGVGQGNLEVSRAREAREAGGGGGGIPPPPPGGTRRVPRGAVK